ncbi:T9SS type B sorting domain-containing protein [Mucilaginibacter agri]|uniref:T9SS type B sorting domain-containing protein n=1 Tax=Mucilaginibacter agri TaxID=2695265 RepID=A0A966DSG4_9SPHI|nr:gliding motility-associated C-terminal domain-containing protein [Mucilaginibacter agri]NCD70103.1 T9SS type B sorting domain-containing protein [Mucilaginibacter agri]
MVNKIFVKLFCFCFLLICAGSSLAQAPNIAYQTPKVYVINTGIPPLSPTNTGGAVPPNTYGLVTRFAGKTGVAGSSGGPLGVSEFTQPIEITTDRLGNVYVNDPPIKSIRKISPTGNVTTIAQGVPVTAGVMQDPNNFDNPRGMAVDGAGNVFVADENNNVIRKIAPNGVISIFAGNRTAGSTDGLGTGATFNHPSEMTIDANDNIYVTDNNNGGTNIIRKITPTGEVSTFVGISGGLNSIGGITINKAGDLFVTIPSENAIKKITSAGLISTYAGNGALGSADGNLTTATFNSPTGISTDGAGNLFVISPQDNLVRKIATDGTVSTFAGQTTPGSADAIGAAASFNSPPAIAMDANGNGYIADAGNHTIRKMSTTGYTIDKPLAPGLFFDTNTGIISGTPTATSASTNYTITAYNAFGSSSAIVRITVIVNTALVFNPLPPKTTCDADFDPGATSVNPIIYTSSQTNVATIIDGNIHIVGAGTTIIYAHDGIDAIPQILKVTLVPKPAISISAVPNPVCTGDPVIFTASADNTGDNPTYQWLVNSIGKGSNSSTYTDVFNNGDIVTCMLTASTACTTPIQSNLITVTVNPLPTVSFSNNNVSVNLTKSITLRPNVTGNVVSYLWSPATGLDDISSPTPVATPYVTTTYTVLATTDGGCVAQTSITVTVINDIIIPNAFTPNNDGRNDLWNIPLLQFFPGCTVNVYNRYGALVFHSVNYSQAWDGTFNNSPLPVGTYYYIIDPKNDKPILSGPVTIIR